jgi:hypothetical protein
VHAVCDLMIVLEAQVEADRRVVDSADRGSREAEGR